MQRLLDRCLFLAAAIGALCVALIAALMVLQSLGRQFGFTTGAINDLVAWLCAAAAFLSMGYAFKQGDFVRVSLLIERFGPKARRRIELACLVVASIALAYLAYWAVLFTYQSWLFKEPAQGLLPIPIWWPQSLFALGSVLFLLAVLSELIAVVQGAIPSYEQAVAERHAKGDFSSDL
jgi:TRAP-type C4-dicarboxylate transport system permease small subunit